jgi:raffinose/stachyose/melibiose transport system substrate-binding protein
VRTRSKAVLKTSLAALAAVGVIAGMSACSSSNSSGDSKTITVQQYSGSGAAAQMNAWIKGFTKENPGVTVKTTTVSDTAKTGQNMQVITSSNAPDVAVVPTNTQAYTNLTQGNQLLPLTDVWSNQNLQKRYGDALANSLKVNGTPYVVSFDAVLYNIVYYNESLFQQAGITVPANRRIASEAQLVDMVDKLKAIGKQGLGIGPTDGYQSSWMVDATLPTSATPGQLNSYLTAWQTKGGKLKAQYTDPAFVNTLDRIQQMGKDGVFQTGYLGQSVSQAEAGFEQQSTGMMLDGSFSTASYSSANVKFDYGWLLLPPIKSGEKTQISTYNGDAYAIPAKAKNPTLAKKFLEYIMTAKAQALLPALSIIPAVNDVPASAYGSLPVQVQQQLADIKANGGQPGWTSVVPGGLGQQLIDPKIQAMLNGSGTPQSVAGAVQSEFETMTAK